MPPPTQTFFTPPDAPPSGTSSPNVHPSVSTRHFPAQALHHKSSFPTTKTGRPVIEPFQSSRNLAIPGPSGSLSKARMHPISAQPTNTPLIVHQDQKRQHDLADTAQLLDHGERSSRNRAIPGPSGSLSKARMHPISAMAGNPCLTNFNAITRCFFFELKYFIIVLHYLFCILFSFVVVLNFSCVVMFQFCIDFNHSIGLLICFIFN